MLKIYKYDIEFRSHDTQKTHKTWKDEMHTKIIGRKSRLRYSRMKKIMAIHE